VSTLQAAIDRLGFALPAHAIEKLASYRELLLAANRRFNLTAVTDPTEVDERLIAESLALLPLIPETSRTLLDIGSGGGIPGLPLAVARPALRVMLLDATEKKVRFLEQTARVLGLDNASTLWGRAEALGRDAAQRERYDVVTARAVARLSTLAEYTLPFAKVGGVVILPKGAGVAEELAEARYAIALLGGSARPLLPTPREGSLIAVFDKVRPTPSNYPRRTGVPAKSPLTAGSRRHEP
jgi:16S rRNA (guanine527-N7)-methyltransferase